MKCQCGNEIQIIIAAQVKNIGCKVLTAFTTIVTAQCEECGKMFQVPISSKNVIVRKD